MMKLVLKCMLILLVLSQRGYAQTVDCCSNIKLLGDETNNLVSKIKHYGGFTYILGTREVSNEKHAIFTKLDVDHNIVWVHQLEFPSELLDFVATDDGAFILVGRTLPAQSDNRSIIAKIFDNGLEGFVLTYDNNQREALFRIIKHPNPSNPSAPYYIAGYENPPGSVSFDDEVHLHNMDANGNIMWSKQLTLGSDDQWSRGILPLADGNLLLMGDYLPSNGAVLAKINGLDGSAMELLRTSIQAAFFDGVLDSNGNIILAGRRGVNNASGFLCLLDNNLNFISSTITNNPSIDIFQELEIDAEDNLYTLGINATSVPILCKARLVKDQIVMTDIKYIKGGESAFSTPRLDVVESTLYYADARVDHALSFGAFDILLGRFDVRLQDNCLSDTILTTSNESFNFSRDTINEIDFTNPDPATLGTNIVNLTINCQSVGATTIDSLTIETCSTDPIEFNGEFYEPGSINEILNTEDENCPSLLILSVVEASSSLQLLQFDECKGSFYIYNDTSIPAGTQEVFTFIDSKGCDSTVIVVVDIVDVIEEFFVEELCEGETYSYNEVEYPTGTDTILQFVDENGCNNRVTLSILPKPSVDFDLLSEDACLNSSNGSIAAQNIQGGISPYTFSIDGQTFVSDSVFADLPPNVYSYQILDANQCLYEQEIEIGATPEFDIDYILPLLTCEEDSTLFEVNIQPNMDTGISWTWSTGSTQNFTYISTPGIYTLDVESKCHTLTETFNLQLESTEQNTDYFYIPNSFSPNLDGINDDFKPFTANDITLLNYEFKIYDRWGNELFSTKDIDYSWDASFKGDRLDSGVYVYWLKAKVLSCRQEFDIFEKGDVTIIR